MSPHYKNPAPTVDLIIELPNEKIVLIERGNPPFGYALPGGFVDYGESLEDAAVREAREETGLEVELVRQFHTYSDPSRDPRKHTITTVFIARADGTPKAGDDAAAILLADRGSLPKMVFDHNRIVLDYYSGRY